VLQWGTSMIFPQLHIYSYSSPRYNIEHAPRMGQN
jgi:hypothetical protein